MEGGKILKNSQIIILGVCIAGATIVSSAILSKGLMRVTKFMREQITVTGSAQIYIKSNYVIWSGTFLCRESDLSDCYKRLQGDLIKVNAYLLANGVNAKEITYSQIYMSTLYKKNENGNDTNDIEGYLLSQNAEVRSEDVDGITKLSLQATELINQGIVFNSGAPMYVYTKLDDLKVEMLAKASENAKERAKSMVKATGNKIGVMRSAKMGVFQITPVNSTDVSDWGVNDTTSIQKKVTAVVSASFAIE